MKIQANPAGLIEQLWLLAAQPDTYFQDDAQKKEFQRLSQDAFTAIEEPFETMQRLAVGPLPLVTARVGQERNIFSTLITNDHVNIDDLSQATNLQSSVLETIMDFLCTQRMARETEQGNYEATQLTHLLMTPLFNDFVTQFHNINFPAYLALNEALKDPKSGKTAFQISQHSEEDFYTWMETHPIQQAAFHRFMEAQFASLPTWLEAVSFESEISHNASADDIVFVDVGGGNGSQCAALKKALPRLQGRIILQDRPAVLEGALEVAGMEKMPHNFLTEQPVKNARAYYLRQIIHNYNDATSVQILKLLLDAMGPESRIFIDDKVLPDEKLAVNAPGVEYTAVLSLVMKALLDAQERREKHWRRLIDQSGMEVVEIRRFTKFNDAIIICKRK